MNQQSINTVASVLAALLAAASLALSVWTGGSDNRKTAAFRDQCRSEIGAALALVDKSRSVQSLDPMAKAFLQRDWQLLRDRLGALKNAAPTVMPDERQLIDGIADAADFAERWASRTDFWSSPPPSSSNDQVIKSEIRKFSDLSDQIFTRDAGRIR